MRLINIRGNGVHRDAVGVALVSCSAAPIFLIYYSLWWIAPAVIMLLTGLVLIRRTGRSR
ncbi:hypothetical protein [Cellulomonas sp. HZM]|uniref:hypothetical protein n=1 Tax=Cellulomonas sp. HZM TaxID=1454010 RepID=UPI000492ED3C|nr:hypothetical protein [Cellulomonas sp. HZM]